MDLERIADYLELLDVDAENERRAYEHAEKKAQRK